MWYVIQVRSGTEESIREQCRKQIPKEILQRAFIPYFEERKRIHGEWITQHRILFPGYVFLVSEHIEELFFDLKNIIGLTRLLGTDQEVVPLYEEEIQFLQSFLDENHTVVISEGIIEDSHVSIRSGPLMGMEGSIRKIDRHKRRAWVEVRMFGRTQIIQSGLEIIEKIP